MKIAAPTSTLVGTAAALPTITSRVDPEGARRMMEMLVNLYADRRLAVVREYVSNAVDATRAAGRVEPVAVTTPTMIEPSLVVTDQGTGMSLEEVEATFLAFAASSKRDSNDLIGGLGVGAKSAWALAESFLVDTVKAGRRTMVRAARNLEHQVLLAGEPSELPDGTTICVPVEVAGHVEAWVRAVLEVAGAHDSGVVLVDGEPVPSLSGGASWIGPVSCRRLDRPDRSAVMIRSGGTLFSSVTEVTRRVLEGTGGLTACVLELPIGSFDHTPSRESIIATDRTLAAVDTALQQYQAAYEALAQHISQLAASDVAAAVALRSDSLGGVGNAKMLPVPFRVSVPAGAGAWSMCSYSHRSRWDRVSTAQGDSFDAINAPAALKETLVVTDVPAGRVLSRFAKFLDEQHPSVRRVIAVPQGQTTLPLNVLQGTTPTEQVFEVGADTNGIAAHYTFTKWSAALAARRATRGPVSGYACVVIERDGQQVRHEVLSGPEIAALGLPVIYVSEARPYQPTCNGWPASVTVHLGKRKTEPLLAAVPSAMTRSAWAEKRFAAEIAGWSPDELLAAAYTHPRWDATRAEFTVGATALATITEADPQHALLRRIAALLHAAENATTAQRATLREMSGCPTAQAQFDKIGALRSELRRAYPLLIHMRSWDTTKTAANFVAYVAHTPPQTADDDQTA
ncbi:ATP-binding protein [Mycobacterium sp.]|uniref:ATP-binding protein n=1 Tax=Mycobacterium sp. TaxID=1785 RepID=UPI0025F5FD01|nr:ATP-binding protein [Mycobacterium sp.]